MAGIVQATTMLDSARYQYSTDFELTAKARSALEKMAWGVRDSGQANRRGIAEAVSVTVSASRIDYTDIQGVAHSIRSNNGNIEYKRGNAAWQVLLDPNGAPLFDPTQYSTTLTFSQTNPNAVTIFLTIGRQLRGRWHYASLSTQIAFRN